LSESEHTGPGGGHSSSSGHPRTVDGLQNAKLLALEHDTFNVPSDATLKKIKPGDFAKIARNGERFWVKIEGFMKRKIFGSVDNILMLNDDLKLGDKILFQKKHIYDVILVE